MSADRVATTEVTFYDKVVQFVMERAAKGAGGNAGHTKETNFRVYLIRSSHRVKSDAVDQE